MSNPKTCADTASATSLPALADGPSHSDSPDGPMTDLFGQAVAPANRSAPPAASVAATMNATYGLRSSASSASVALQQSLASRLQERLASRGLTMFALTWKAKATPLRRQICQLAASARPTDGSGCSGWQTPLASDGQVTQGRTREFLRGRALLSPVEALAPWPTPKAGDSDKGVRTHRGAEKELSRKGPGADLPTLAVAAAWPTPMAGSPATATYNAAGNNDYSRKAVELASPWATPSARDWKDSPGMATTGTNPDGSTRARTDQLPRQAHGVISSGSPAPTENPGQLNPAFSRWLQGYPRAWCEAAIEAWHRTPTRARKRV